jgi:hypothetical protein
VPVAFRQQYARRWHGQALVPLLCPCHLSQRREITGREFRCVGRTPTGDMQTRDAPSVSSDRRAQLQS